MVFVAFWPLGKVGLRRPVGAERRCPTYRLGGVLTQRFLCRRTNAQQLRFIPVLPIKHDPT